MASFQETKEMLDDIKLNFEKDQFNKATLDVNSIRPIFENHLTSNYLEDEISEFFREVAALKGQSINDTLHEMRLGVQKYIEAVNTPIEFKNNMPTNINQYVNKIEKLSTGIESCWDIFSQDSQQFFINLAHDFCRASSKFQGWRGIWIRWQLIWPSIKQRENLFKKYRDSFWLIPKAVNRAIELRDSKSTDQLQTTAKSLLHRAKEISTTEQTLLPFLRHLGRTEEEQLKKNQAAMAWAKARLEEIRNKRNEYN